MAASPISLFLMATLAITGSVAHVLPKRSITDNLPDTYDYYEYSEKLDRPIEVSKRAALLLDRLMVALQKAIQDPATSGSGGMDASVSEPNNQKSRKPRLIAGTSATNQRPTVNRRTQKKKPTFRRCYFNPVTCF